MPLANNFQLWCDDVHDDGERDPADNDRHRKPTDQAMTDCAAPQAASARQSI
jgi:hypothetical protein